MPYSILISLSLTQITSRHWNVVDGLLLPQNVTTSITGNRSNYSYFALHKNVVSRHVTPCSLVKTFLTIQRHLLFSSSREETKKKFFYPKYVGSRFPETSLTFHDTTRRHISDTTVFTYAFVRDTALQTKFCLIIPQQHQTSN
jgi:hypothetical protein